MTPHQDWREKFKEKCLLTIDGKCKYWKPDAFGYKEDDREAPLDKFFPEEILDFISSTIIPEKVRDLIIKQVGAIIRGNETKEQMLHDLRNLQEDK